jgi:predicted TIM-barrel fold metal-dependent hydrolase
MNANVKEPLISVDSHVQFTDEWVKERLSARMKGVWDEAVRQHKAAEVAARGGRPPLAIEDFVDMEAANDPGHFEPQAKLAAMDRDGVQAEVIFPEIGGNKICSPKYMGADWKEGIKGFNQAMADFAAYSPSRLLTAYQMPISDIPFAVSEVERLAQQGARCVQVHPYPSELGLPDVHDPSYEPLWSAVSEANLTVMNHLEIKASMLEIFKRDPTPQRGIYTMLPSIGLAETILFWILTGTMEKFPKLRVMFVEPGLGWLPWLFEKLDERMHMHYRFPGVTKLPSETFKTQMGATFMYEPTGQKAAYDAFGPEPLFWSTDFPHPATCWPNSQKQVKSQFAEAGLPEDARRKIIYENAQKLFGLGQEVSA